VQLSTTSLSLRLGLLGQPSAPIPRCKAVWFKVTFAVPHPPTPRPQTVLRAMREGRAKSNPAALTHKRQERPRDRVLSDAELGLIWRALGEDHYSIIVKLLMLTGQRLSEITALRWSEIDFDRGAISLPAGRTKNHRAHDIPITPTMAALLRAQPRRGELVFGRGANGYAGAGHSKERLDRALTIQPWTHHDLRRTAVCAAACGRSCAEPRLGAQGRCSRNLQ
jgi:integrase